MCMPFWFVIGQVCCGCTALCPAVHCRGGLLCVTPAAVCWGMVCPAGYQHRAYPQDTWAHEALYHFRAAGESPAVTHSQYFVVGRGGTTTLDSLQGCNTCWDPRCDLASSSGHGCAQYIDDAGWHVPPTCLSHAAVLAVYRSRSLMRGA